MEKSSAEGAATRGTHRVNVNFSESAYEALREIARSRGKTLSEVLRDAIAFEQWYEETVNEEHARLLIEREDGSLRELVRSQ